MSLFLLDKVKDNKDLFAKRVYVISELLGIVPDWLMIVMNFESGLNPKAVNQASGATGLIQFMPSTAQGLGTTTTALLDMSNVEQLTYVYKYLARYAGRIDSLTDLYLCVFYPAAVGKDDNYQLGGAKVAQQNSIFDSNKDGVLTKSEVTKYIDGYAQRIGYAGVTKRTNALKKKLMILGICTLTILLTIKD